MEATAPAADDATKVNPTVDSPAVMATETTSTIPAPSGTYDAPAVADAPVDSDGDMATLVGIIKNITDRLAALEEAISSTKMSVEKMSAAPAAAAFNATPATKGTIGEYLEAYKKEIKAKQEAKKEAMLKFSASREVEKPLVFSKANGPAPVAAPVKTDNKMDLGLGSFFSVSSNK